VHLLVIGGSGLLGHEVTRQARLADLRVTATYWTRASPVAGADWCRLDVRRRDDVAALVGAVRPDVVVNAAYRQSDWATTADGGANVGFAAAAAGARLVHVSSDAVFSGAAVAYDESCLPDPATAYGAAKAAAETAVKAMTPTAVIVRTSLIIGNGASRHEKHVHGLASGSTNGVLFTDDVKCPVHVSDLASGILELALSSHTGVHHLAGSDAISRYELGVLIARRDGLDPSRLPAGPRAVAGGRGPVDVRLDCARSQEKLTTRLRGAREFLAR
jgi:dTDP-4-dehydrorhamnose reductase